MTTVEVAETGPGRTHRLSDAQAAQLTASGLVSVSPLGGGEWLITGSSKVGVAQIGDVTLRVSPKVTTAKLFWLLGYARKFDWRDDLVDYEADTDLVHVIAEAFARQSERALGRGVLHGYVSIDDELAVIRGRLRATEQVTRRYGQITPLLVTYDEFTPDIAENQLLKAAARVLSRVPGLQPGVARHLRVVTDRLASVRDLAAGAQLPDWRPSRRNAHYETALFFAELVLRHQAIDLPAGVVDVNGFMVDMAAVFEDFVTVALTDEFERVDGQVRAQDRHSLDLGGDVPMKPDIVWYRAGQPAAVIDAKYKAEKPAGYPNADVYQMLAYCTALNLREGHLVYAKGNEEPALHDIRNADISIVAHALDLSAPPSDLLAQVAAVARRIQHAQPATIGDR